ncbi:hypothetical protein [Actinoplanes sp. NPDC051859]|uniref:hypothetical protein n=1 Tax=Actinoplanes sp. NPDC051859 TaxID=3363909 RepID=UPI00378E14A1
MTVDALTASIDPDSETPVHRCERCADVQTNLVCSSCVSCNDCQRVIRQDDVQETLDGAEVCETCLFTAYSRCWECDGWNRDGDDCANGCDDDDDVYCGGLIREYGYKPGPDFRGDGPLFLGPEIEVEVFDGDLRRCAQLAIDHLGELGYLKEDGSLHHGFEIVTHPMSYDWAIAHFPWDMLAELQRSGCRTNDDTGMHVHVSRAAFTGAGHIYRWMKFVYRNESDVIALARRTSTLFAAFSADARRSVKDHAKGGYGDDRHHAINTTNAATFELRMFASSLEPAEVKAALAFAAASIEYTRELTVAAICHDRGWTWQAFVGWLAEHPTYAPLHNHLEQQSCAC